MKTSIAILSASVASAMASPFPISSKHCNVAPSASVNGKVQPYHNGKADTAIDCQTYCASDDSCKSFAFGLAKGAHEPSCLLFKVAAAKVPARKDGLHVFDRECAADRVPTSAPTTGQPWGTVPKKVLARRGTQCNCAASGSANADVQPFKTATAATAKDCQVLAEADTSCMSFLFGLSDDSKSPVCKLYKVAASSIPARSDKLFVFDKGCSSKQVPTTAPTEDAPRGLVPGASKVAKDAKATKVQKSQPKATKVTKVEGKKTEQEGDYEVPSSKPKTTKVQKSQPKVTKVANGEGNKVQYAEPEATQQAEKPKPKSTKIVNSNAKATKAAKVENEENQYAEPAKSSKTKTKAAEVNNDNNSKAQDTKDKAEDNKQTKVTKVKDTKVKATKVAKVENENENVQYAEPSKVSNTKAKATKVENQEQKATKVAKVESNKDTNNKDSKVESPKTLVTKVRNNEQQATQAAKVDGKSECKTTKVKVSNNQAKATQAY
ncbi:hypothetical protein ACHAPO_009754 [Fusarium lateritium]